MGESGEPEEVWWRFLVCDELSDQFPYGGTMLESVTGAATNQPDVF